MQHRLALFHYLNFILNYKGIILRRIVIFIVPTRWLYIGVQIIIRRCLDNIRLASLTVLLGQELDVVQLQHGEGFPWCLQLGIG